MATESTRKADPQAGIYFPLQGALRAALDAYLQASSPQTLDGSASSAITGNGLPASHPAGTVPSPAARFGTATLANRQTAFDNLLNLWTGVDSIAAGARSGGLSLRQATILELVYGTGYQNADFEQAGIWGIAYRNLTEGLYAGLATQTHLTQDYALIDWRVHANINEEIGHLDAVTAVFKQRMAEAIAADAAASSAATLAAGAPITVSASYDAVRTGINEFGRVLRGLDLTRSSTYFAFREAFTVEVPAGLDSLAANDAALRTFAFDTAGIATSIWTTSGRGNTDTDAVFTAPTVVGGSNWGGLWGDVRRRMNVSAAPRSCRRTYHSRLGITCRTKKLLRRTA